ncbi:MAG: zinc ribbon domain-containing protein [Anaerovorax sp.]
MALSERIYHCENCGAILDRYYNACINIKNGVCA